MLYVLFISLLLVPIGIFIRQKIWGEANKPKTIFEYGRAWAAYVAFITPFASIHNFIQYGFSAGLVKFLVLIIIYPLIGFILGCVYGLFKVKNTSSNSQLVTNTSEVQSKQNISINSSLDLPKVGDVQSSERVVIEELNSSEEWDLAYKYDDNLKADFSALLAIDSGLAKEFQAEVINKKLLLNYKELLAEYMKKGLGVSAEVAEYSPNMLINHIATLLVNDSPVATKEFMQLVRLYKLEEVESSDILASKLMPLLQKLEKNNGIRITNKVNFDMPTDSLIKFGMYKESMINGYKLLNLPNGLFVAVTQAEYRVYDSEESAVSAIEIVSKGGLWTLKGLVEKLPSDFVFYDGRCPSCDAPIDSKAESCYRCNAIFDNTSNWKPVV